MTASRPTLLALTLVAFLFAVAQGAHAQIFQNFFGGGGVRREQEAPPAGDAKWFHDRVDAASCQQYLCPRTLSCVSKPSHCPCPFQQQIRCAYRDTDSEAVAKSSSAGGTFDGVDAQLDLGGTSCVTATSCDEVTALLGGAGRGLPSS